MGTAATGVNEVVATGGDMAMVTMETDMRVKDTTIDMKVTVMTGDLDTTKAEDIIHISVF